MSTSLTIAIGALIVYAPFILWFITDTKKRSFEQNQIPGREHIIRDKRNRRKGRKKHTMRIPNPIPKVYRTGKR